MRSPIGMATRIKAPVLLVAGGADQVAPIVHSKRMANALRKAGNPAETLFVDTEGHAWEVAHNPGFALNEDGTLTLPDFDAL